MTAEILVVIPTIIDHDLRGRLLDQLGREELVSTVLVIDNGDCFKVPGKKRTEWAKVQHVRPGCNLNWLHSNNYGAAIALERDIPFVCFLNDDVRISNRFFKQMLKTFRDKPKAGIVVPQYTGKFGDRAFNKATPHNFQPSEGETQVNWTDGTCMLISRETLKTVGFLDPTFRAPGWGSDVDYSHRVSESGGELYVSHRAMLWHYDHVGGFSATEVYGDRQKWVSKGMEQAAEDLRAKYGPHWRDVLPLPPNAYIMK